MNWIRGAAASLALLFAFLPARPQTQAVKKKAITADGAKQTVAAAIGETNRVNDAKFFEPDDSTSSQVTYFSNQQVASSFAKEGNGFNVLYDGRTEGMTFEVRTDRRDGPGTANVHALFTEIYIVEGGTATYVSGGTVVNPKTSDPNEIR